MTAQQVFIKATTNAQARTLSLDGTASGSGVSYHLKLGVTMSGDCQGTIGYLTKGSISFVETYATAWLKPDDAWWAANTGSNGNGLNQLLDGRYFEQDTAAGTFLTPWCDSIQTISGSGDWKHAVKGQVTTFNGVRVLPLDGAHGSVLYVTDTAKPELEGIFEPATSRNGDSAALDISVGAPVALNIPGPTQTVSGADFGFTSGLSGSTPISDLSAAMLEAAFTNLHAAKSLTMTGSGTDSGQSYSFDMGFKPKQGCAGTITYPGSGSFKFVVIDSTVYYDPDDQLWESQDGGNSAAASAVIGIVNGRYIEGPASDSTLQPIAAICQMPQDIGQSAPLPSGVMVSAEITRSGKAPASATEKVGNVTTVNGIRALPISDSSGDSVDLSDTGTLEIAKVTAADSGGVSGYYTLNVGAPVTLAAPPASDTVAASSLGI